MIIYLVWAEGKAVDPKRFPAPPVTFPGCENLPEDAVIFVAFEKHDIVYSRLWPVELAGDEDQTTV